MSIFDDILKGLPANPLLREKLSAAEAKQAELETEVALLKDQLRDSETDKQQLRKENEELKNRIEEFTHIPDLDEIKVAILVFLAQHNGSLYVQELVSISQMSLTTLEYHLHELIKQDYVETLRPRLTRPTVCRLRQKGREYVIENGLV
ncbi:MAG: ArsR family transcriptional regulator [Pyrinomonadaceae bacterium]